MSLADWFDDGANLLTEEVPAPAGQATVKRGIRYE